MELAKFGEEKNPSSSKLLVSSYQKIYGDLQSVSIKTANLTYTAKMNSNKATLKKEAGNWYIDWCTTYIFRLSTAKFSAETASEWTGI